MMEIEKSSLSRADSPGATFNPLCPNSHWRALAADMCSGGNRRNHAAYGDRAYERQYRGSDAVAVARVFASTINSAGHGANWKGCMMHEQRRWFVGIDCALQEHVVSLCDD
jgi:hypothetical protein